MDTNHDGVLSAAEVKASNQGMMDALRDAAHTNGEWDMISELARIKGEYLSLCDGTLKGTEPGEGGRFALMVDRLKSQGYPESSARALAASIGKAKYAWMR